MITYKKSYYRRKNNLEWFLLRKDNFRDVSKRFELSSKNVIYPILAKENGFTYKVNKYQGYIYGSLHYFYFYRNRLDYKPNTDLTYSQMCKAIDAHVKRTVDIEESKIITLYFGFTLTTNFKAEDFIRKNVLMHNYKGYNHNKGTSSNKKELKIFDYDEYDIVLSADKNQDNFKQNKLKVELRIKDSKVLANLGVCNDFDLKKKRVVEKLFDLLLKKYDELIIVDSCENLDQFSNKEQLKIPLYMNIDYWKELPKIKDRQAKSRSRKDFERIQSEYSLNTLKKELRELLINAFDNFLKN